MQCHHSLCISVFSLAKQRKRRSGSEQDGGRSRATSEDAGNRARTTSEDYCGRDRTASNVSDSDTGGCDSGGRNRAFSAVSDSSWDIPLPAQDKRRSSSRLLSVGANDAALAAAGDKLQATQQATGRLKNLSLAHQLDQIKGQGTEAFLKCIVPQKDPIFPAGKRTWKGLSASQPAQKTSSDSLPTVLSNGKEASESNKPQPPATNKTGLFLQFSHSDL